MLFIIIVHFLSDNHWFFVLCEAPMMWGSNVSELLEGRLRGGSHQIWLGMGPPTMGSTSRQGEKIPRMSWGCIASDVKWRYNMNTAGRRWPRKSRGSILTRRLWCLCWRGWRPRASRLSIQKTRQWLFQARSRFRSGWLGCLLIDRLWFQISTINNLQVETASKDVPDSPRPSEGSTYKSLTPQEEVHRSQFKAE